MPGQREFSNMTVEEALKTLDTAKAGLSADETRKRLEKYGRNELTIEFKLPAWLMFLRQFKDVLVLVLIVAGIISFMIGSFRDGVVMFIIVFMNAIIGFVQQYKAEKILDRLKTLIKSPAKVVQGGELVEFDQTKLVPGQIVFIEEGDKVPADLRIIESFNLRTNDFSLTGESMPQSKRTMAIPGKNSLGDMDNMAFVGTTVATGNGKGVVVATGMNTEMGKIANMTQETVEALSPLQKELGHMANRLTVLVVAISIILFIVAKQQGFDLYTSLIYALGIAVALVPQALPAQVTVALTTASGRLADRKAVVKNLPSVETLGCTQVICTDKTGTLTKNEMTVREIWFDGRNYTATGIGYEPKGTLLDEADNPLSQEEIDYIEIMMDASTMASNAEIHPPDKDHPNWYPVGDPTEAALITLSTKLGTRSPIEDEENPELHEIPFDSVRKRMSSVRGFGDKEILTMKGALKNVLDISKHIYKDGKTVPITARDISEIRAVSEGYQKKAMRVLAIAYRPLETTGTYITEDLERDMIFLGIVGMSDPPKDGVKEAIEAAHAAKIRVFIMTGDHAITAQAVGMEIGLSDNGGPTPVITGTELIEMDDKYLTKRLMAEQALIFSRVDPGDKLRIVKLLEEQDLVVAVTGDGVNDAPALKLAHIGVAMGQTGTDVAKEAAEVILLDDSFPTLVHAVEEGRTIYANLKKTVVASLTTNAAELVIVLLGLAAVAAWDWAIPILAIQILAIDLMAEILPLTFLTFDPPTKEVMRTRPRRGDEHMLTRRYTAEIVYFGFLIGFLAFINYAMFMYRNGGAIFVGDEEISDIYPKATTIAWVTIAFCQYLNIVSRRSEHITIFNRNLFENRKLLMVLAISAGLVLMAVYIPVFNYFLGFAPLALEDWLYVGLTMGIFLLVYETMKAGKRGHMRRANHKQ